MPAPSREEFAVAPTYRSVVDHGVEDGAARTVTLTEPFRALRRDGMVWTNQGERMGGDDFSAHATRCSDDGMPIIPLVAPLQVQLTGLRAYLDAFPAADLSGHYEDVRILRGGMPARAAEIEDPAERAEALMTDAMLLHVRDTAVPQGTQATPPEGPRGPDPVIRIMSRETRIDENRWMHASDMPAFQVETMRAMARQMLAPVLGNAAHLEDLRFLVVPNDERERSGALRRWIQGAGGSRTLEPFRHEAMPGYATDAPVVAERDGVALLTYSDGFATYAWAWQANPGMALDMPEPQEPDPEDGPGFR